MIFFSKIFDFPYIIFDTYLHRRDYFKPPFFANRRRAPHFQKKIFAREKLRARKSQGSIVRLIEREKEREKKKRREREVDIYIYIRNGTEKVAIEKIEIEGTNARPRTTKGDRQRAV